jgi:hypothetical protein
MDEVIKSRGLDMDTWYAECKNGSDAFFECKQMDFHRILIKQMCYPVGMSFSNKYLVSRKELATDRKIIVERKAYEKRI